MAGYGFSKYGYAGGRYGNFEEDDNIHGLFSPSYQEIDEDSDFFEPSSEDEDYNYEEYLESLNAVQEKIAELEEQQKSTA